MYLRTQFYILYIYKHNCTYTQHSSLKDNHIFNDKITRNKIDLSQGYRRYERELRIMRDSSQVVTESGHPEKLHRSLRFAGHRPGDGVHLHRRYLDDSGEKIQNTRTYNW